MKLGLTALLVLLSLYSYSQSDKIFLLPTNATDTIAYREMGSGPDGLGEVYYFRKTIGRKYVYYEGTLSAIGGTDPQLTNDGLDIYKFFNARVADQSWSGKVFLSAIVEYNGKLSHVNILAIRTANGNLTEKEAKKILKRAPRCIPGTLNNKRVRAQISWTLLSLNK